MAMVGSRETGTRSKAKICTNELLIIMSPMADEACHMGAAVVWCTGRLGAVAIVHEFVVRVRVRAPAINGVTTGKVFGMRGLAVWLKNPIRKAKGDR